MHEFFDVPLKRAVDLPCLKYDVALYCQVLNQMLPIVPPDYLKDYAERIRALALSAQDYCPQEFPDCTRTYIFDSRMHTLFAMLDPTKVTTTVMYTYAQEAFEMKDYFFGDGPPSCGVIDEGKELERFVKKYQFIPNDFFAFNHVAFFFQDRFIASSHLSNFQTAILLDRFKRQNLVDFKKLADQEVQLYRDKLPF